MAVVLLAMRAERTGPRILVALYPNIGDVVNQTPLLRWIRNEYPDATIVAMTSGSAANLLENNPHIDHVWLRPKGLAGRFRFLLQMRRLRCDLAILTNRHNPTLLLCILGRARRVVGIAHDRYRGSMETVAVVPQGGRRISSGILAIAEYLGLEADSEIPQVIPSQEDRDWIAEQAGSKESQQRWVAIQTQASHPRKTWPGERFAQVWQTLESEGCRILLIGGGEERALIDSIIPPGSQARSLVGRLSLLQTAALLERCDLLLSNDTGPMHIAAAMGTPVVGIYGPTLVAEHAPFGDSNILIQGDCDCALKSSTACTGACMESVSVQTVLDACRKILAKPPHTGTFTANEDSAGT